MVVNAMIQWIESRATKKKPASYTCRLNYYAAYVFQWMPNLWTAQITGPNNFGYQRVLPTSDQAKKWAEDQLITLNNPRQPLQDDDTQTRSHNRSTTG